MVQPKAFKAQIRWFGCGPQFDKIFDILNFFILFLVQVFQNFWFGIWIIQDDVKISDYQVKIEQKLVKFWITFFVRVHKIEQPVLTSEQHTQLNEVKKQILPLIFY